MKIIMNATEIVTIIYALFMEAAHINNPDINFIPRKNCWLGLLVAIPLLLMGVAYMLYSFYWFLMDVPVIRMCSGILIALTFLSLFEIHSGLRLHPIKKRLDAGISFVCVFLIGYSRFIKGW